MGALDDDQKVIDRPVPRSRSFTGSSNQPACCML
jgi:hypothetical protein